MVKDAWTPGLLKSHFDERLNHLNEEMIRELDGFPQEYARRAELESLRALLESIRIDHVQRREIEEIKNNQNTATERVRARLDEANGRRSATLVAISILSTVFAVTFGIIWNNQLDHNDVSTQIQHEAPWVADKPDVERRIDQLEKQSEALRLRIVRNDTQISYLCSHPRPRSASC